jgi:hypothetical protein
MTGVLRLPEVPTSQSKFAKLDTLPFFYLLFFPSGFLALLYQIVWQRA